MVAKLFLKKDTGLRPGDYLEGHVLVTNNRKKAEKFPGMFNNIVL